MRVGFADHLWVVDIDMAQFQGAGCEGHSHTVVFVGVYGFRVFYFNLGPIPFHDGIIVVCNVVAQFGKFLLQGGYAVGFLDAEALKACESERHSHHAAGHDKCLCQVGLVDEVAFETFHRAWRFAKGHGLHTLVVGDECSFHSKTLEDSRHLTVALVAVGEQYRQAHLKIG